MTDKTPLEQVRDLSLAWAKRGNFTLSAKEARLLDCCRICKDSRLGGKNPDVFLTDCGGGFGHKNCLISGETNPNKDDIAIDCDNCKYPIPSGIPSFIEEDGERRCSYCHHIREMGMEIARLENEIEYMAEKRDQQR